MATSQTIYEQLTETTAAALALRLRLFEEGTFLRCKQVYAGNQHLVFQITDEKSENGILIKQALPCAKENDVNKSVSLKHTSIEATALLSAADYVPSHVPRVYYYDEVLGVTIMEDFSHLKNVESGFIEGNTYPLLSEHIGTFLANTLFYTSEYGLGATQKKTFMKAFNSPGQSKDIENLSFADFDGKSDYSDEKLRNVIEQIGTDEALRHEVYKLKQKYKTNKDALLHGNLHTGNIFASGTETKIINPELARFGPLGYDMGLYFANLLLIAISKDCDNQEPFFQHIEKTWEVFSGTFSNLWNNEGVELSHKNQDDLQELLEQTLKDSIGFAGCEIIYRTIGQKKGTDLDNMFDSEQRIAIKQHALRLGKQLILNRAILTELETLRNCVEKTAVERQHELANSAIQR